MSITNDRALRADRVTWVGFATNLLLFLFKFAAGIFGHSAAMIADAVHSVSDFITDIVVLVSFRIIRKPIDKGHDYGHGKFETLATTVVGIALLLVGVGILVSGLRNILMSFRGVPLGRPGIIALIAAVISIITKEWLYRYTVKTGREINSQAVIANAWHHRSDAFSSIGTMIGIGGAILLGEQWRILDPIAAVVVSIFIIKVAMSISISSIRELTEESLDDRDEREILSIVKNIPGVIEPHNLRTRRIGNSYAIDLHVRVDRDLSVTHGHDIASQVEAGLRERFGQESFVSIHIEPYRPGSDSGSRT